MRSLLGMSTKAIALRLTDDPCLLAGSRPRTKIWRWADVAQWFGKTLNESLPDTADSAFLQAFNDALEIRRLTTGLGKPQRQAIAAALPQNLAAA